MIQRMNTSGAALTNTLDIHEVGVGTLHQPLLLVPCPLLRKTRVHQILNHTTGNGEFS